MFSNWLISMASACFQVSILMGHSVETTPVPRPKDAPPSLVSSQNSKTNYSGISDIDYEVYAYYLPFLKEQNVSNEEADYSYYENDYLSYYSYDKSVDEENNSNHLPDEDDAAWISRETEVTTIGDYRDVTALKSLSKTASDELLTTKIVVTTNELQQNAPSEREKPRTMPAMKDVASLSEARYVIDDSLKDVTEPYRPENDGLKSVYKGIDVIDDSLKDVTERYRPENDGSKSAFKGIDVTETSLKDVTEPYRPENDASKSAYKGIDVTETGLKDVSEPYRPENDGSKSAYKGIDVTETSLKDVTEPYRPENEGSKSAYKGIDVTETSLKDVREPYRPENDGSKSAYKGIDVTETSLKDVTDDYLSWTKTNATINYLEDDVESGNGTKDSDGAKELDVWNICLIPVEEGSSSCLWRGGLLFPCSSLEMQPVCVGLDHRIGACSDISEGTSRRICVKKENSPSVVPCDDPSSEAFCFESSAKDRIIPCQADNKKRICLFEKGHLEICSAVRYDKLAFL